MQNNVLEAGDIIRIERFGYWHVGIYVGPRSWFGAPEVVHNKKGDGVIASSLAEFADGCKIIIHRKATGGYWERRRIAQQALSLIGKRYDLINFNCEHAAHLAQTGKAESPQIAGLALLLLVVGGLAMFSRKG